MEVSDLSNNNTFPSHAAEALEGGAAIPPTSGAGQGDALVGAPPSISDSWTYFKAHGTLPDLNQVLPALDHLVAGSSAMAGAVGGGTRGSVPLPLPRARVTDLYPVIVPDDTQASIPGMGADCGLPERFSKRLVICSGDPTHKHYEVGGSSCGKPTCPRHWETWGRRAADRGGRVLWGYKAASKGRHKPRHTILSEDDTSPLVLKRASFSDKANIRFFRKHFIRKALALGGTGGSIVVHLWRTNDMVPTWIEGSRRWDWVRSKGTAWRAYVDFSPHAHVTGYGFYQEPEPGDFSYRNLEHLDDRDAVESVLFYQLSHAPVGAGCNALTYWGCCQPGCLKVAVVNGKKQQWKEHVPVPCGTCGLPMVYADSREEYLRTRSCAVYIIVTPPPRKKKKKKTVGVAQHAD